MERLHHHRDVMSCEIMMIMLMILIMKQLFVQLLLMQDPISILHIRIDLKLNLYDIRETKNKEYNFILSNRAHASKEKIPDATS